MRILVLGGGGMLGRDLCDVLPGEVHAPSRDEVDLADPRSVTRAAEGMDVVINAAAYTDVDGAEADEATATAVNGAGAGAAAAAASTAGARFVQVSTDYVFGGDADTPYSEDAPVGPRTAYGRSKAAGEAAVRAAHPSPTIVRTAWLYGAHGRSFPRTMLALAAQRPRVDVVADQRGQPTWTRDLAGAIRALIESGTPAGVFHGTNGGETTWFDFARTVFASAGLDPERVHPVASAAFPRPAVRPAYSVLGHDAWRRADLPEPRPWADAFADAVRSGAVSA